MPREKIYIPVIEVSLKTPSYEPLYAACFLVTSPGQSNLSFVLGYNIIWIACDLAIVTLVSFSGNADGTVM
jgi:hypothetical protein